MRDIVPIKLYEYLACGKPVITTKLPGVMKEFGKNSGIVHVDLPKDVVEQAKAIYNDEKMYRNHSQTVLHFTESLDWSKITESFLRVLQKLVGERKSLKKSCSSELRNPN